MCALFRKQLNFLTKHPYPCVCALCHVLFYDVIKMAARKVLITGASGLLGRELMRRFRREGWECKGLAYSRVRGSLVRVDLCEREEVEGVVEDFKPHIVVHSAAERRPDVVSKKEEQAKALNVGATEILTQICQQRSIFLLYISTDYVFDGLQPPYSPQAPTNPLNAYGVSKRDGELAVQNYQRSAVLRVPVLYGAVETLAESAVTTLLSSVLDSSKEARMSHYEQRYPTHIQDVAQVCEGICSRQAAGVWHCSGGERLTKYSMACIMAEVFGLPSTHLLAVTEPSGGTPRPYDSQLDCSSTQSVVPTAQTPFRAGIRQVLEPFLLQ